MARWSAPTAVPVQYTGPAARVFGRSHTRKPGEMTKLEARYSELLAGRLLAGEIQRYDFEPESLRCGPGQRYTPDFRTVCREGFVEFREVKPTRKDASGARPLLLNDSVVKLKACALLHPYKFFLCWLHPVNGWIEEEI